MIKKTLLLLFIATLTLSCGGDDDSGNGTNYSYLPLSVNNSWDYDVATGTTIANDNLTVESVNGSSYELTATPAVPAGLMTNLLSSGTLTAQNGQLLSNGTIGFNFQGVGDFSIDVTDAPVYDQNASAGSTLYTTQGTFNQSIQNFDLDINYTATTIQQSNIASMTVPAGTFSDVLHSQLIINVSISTDVMIGPLTQTITLLQPQDAIVVDNYWAKDVGLISSNNQLDYMLEDFSQLGINLPVPQSASILTTQELTTYTVN